MFGKRYSQKRLLGPGGYSPELLELKKNSNIALITQGLNFGWSCVQTEAGLSDPRESLLTQDIPLLYDSNVQN